MKYEIYKIDEIEGGKKLLTLESRIFGHSWLSGRILEETLPMFTESTGMLIWKLKGFKHKSGEHMDLIFDKGLPLFLEWYWGESHFWDAGRQGGHATYFTGEMLTLWRPDTNLCIMDLWLGQAGFYYKPVDDIHKTFIELATKAVDCYVKNDSPAYAVGYPGADWPSTTKPGYHRGRGPAKSTISQPQKFLNDRQHKDGIWTPKSIDGSV